MAKKAIIMTAAGLVTFTGTFVFAWLTHSPPAKPSDPSEQPIVPDSQAEQESTQSETYVIDAVAQTSALTKRAMTEQQLKDLIQNVRGKMQEYENKVKSLAVQEKRLHFPPSRKRK